MKALREKILEKKAADEKKATDEAEEDFNEDPGKKRIVLSTHQVRLCCRELERVREKEEHKTKIYTAQYLTTAMGFQVNVGHLKRITDGVEPVDRPWRFTHTKTYVAPETTIPKYIEAKLTTLEGNAQSVRKKVEKLAREHKGITGDNTRISEYLNNLDSKVQHFVEYTTLLEKEIETLKRKVLTVADQVSVHTVSFEAAEAFMSRAAYSKHTDARKRELKRQHKANNH